MNTEIQYQPEVVLPQVNGVSEEVMQQIDTCLEIPQFGTKHSFNIVISTGIVLNTGIKLLVASSRIPAPLVQPANNGTTNTFATMYCSLECIWIVMRKKKSNNAYF